MVISQFERATDGRKGWNLHGENRRCLVPDPVQYRATGQGLAREPSLPIRVQGRLSKILEFETLKLLILNSHFEKSSIARCFAYPVTLFFDFRSILCSLTRLCRKDTLTWAQRVAASATVELLHSYIVIHLGEWGLPDPLGRMSWGLPGDPQYTFCNAGSEVAKTKSRTTLGTKSITTKFAFPPFLSRVYNLLSINIGVIFPPYFLKSSCRLSSQCCSRFRFRFWYFSQIAVHKNAEARVRVLNNDTVAPHRRG